MSESDLPSFTDPGSPVIQDERAFQWSSSMNERPHLYMPKGTNIEGGTVAHVLFNALRAWLKDDQQACEAWLRERGWRFIETDGTCYGACPDNK